MNEFMQAAASYLGLGEGVARKVEVFTDAGTMCIAFEVALSPDDVVAICDRMKARREVVPALQVLVQVEPEVPGYEELVRDTGWSPSNDQKVLARRAEILDFRNAWDRLTDGEKSTFRSRYNYLLDRARTMDAIHGSVTSNADDFGGMPG